MQDFSHIRNITVSGRIATGATTLGEELAEKLGWRMLNGGKVFRELAEELGISISDAKKRPDKFDIEYEERVKKILRTESHYVVQSHLAGFDAQGIEGVFKVLTLCLDHDGRDKTEVRIDRLVNREEYTVQQAKYEVIEREKQHLEKFRQLYANNDPEWVYWNESYYDLVVNTYELNKQESLAFVLEKMNQQNR